MGHGHNNFITADEHGFRGFLLIGVDPRASAEIMKFIHT
jgi:hypothetical protein